MQENYEEYYRKYWDKEFENRRKIKYFERLYDCFKSRIKVNDRKYSVVDIGGGNGHFMYYLGMKNCTVVDISDSGLRFARKLGMKTIKGDLHKRLSIKESSFDVAYCFEVLEHLNYPSKTLAEINNILKKDGVLYVGQPNTPADGKHHVRRIYVKDLIDDLEKSGFKIEWVEYIPAFNSWQRDITAIRTSKGLISKAASLIAYMLTYLPHSLRKWLAYRVPDRFALMYIIKCKKIC